MGSVNKIENDLIEQIQEIFENQTTLNKKMEDVFYEVERYETSIIIKNIGSVDVSLRGIRIYELKSNERDWLSDSIGDFFTPYIFSYSKKFKDYVIIEDFPKYEIDEDSDGMYYDAGMNDLTFKELISYFKKIKKINSSKIEIEDEGDLTYCD
jgi:hypothetical protein